MLPTPRTVYSATPADGSSLLTGSVRSSMPPASGPAPNHLPHANQCLALRFSSCTWCTGSRMVTWPEDYGQRSMARGGVGRRTTVRARSCPGMCLPGVDCHLQHAGSFQAIVCARTFMHVRSSAHSCTCERKHRHVMAWRLSACWPHFTCTHTRTHAHLSVVQLPVRPGALVVVPNGERPHLTNVWQEQPEAAAAHACVRAPLSVRVCNSCQAHIVLIGTRRSTAVWVGGCALLQRT